MIPVSAMLSAWRDTKRDRCADPDPEMGRDLLPQLHLVLADGEPVFVMCEQREYIPALPSILQLTQPIVSATFMADSWHRESTDMGQAKATQRGDLGRAFHAGDPDVSEALVLHAVGDGEPMTMIQPYVIGDDGLPRWGEVVSLVGMKSEGAIPDLLATMIQNSYTNPGRNQP